MFSHWAKARRVMAWLVLVCVFGACAKVHEIPRDEIGAAGQQNAADYHIWMKGGDDYYARRYSVTDSTVVIQELQESDTRYKKQEMPIVIPLADVERVTVVKNKYWIPALVGIAVAGIIAMVIVMDPIDFSD